MRSINRKNNLFYRYKSKPSKRSKYKYVTYKNILTKILRIEKRNYYTNQLNLYQHDVKNTWKIIKNAMNTFENNSALTKVKCNDIIGEEPVDIADTFNSYFSSIGKELAHKIAPSTKQFQDFLGDPNPKSIFLSPVSKNEILEIVNNLKDKKSAGHDGIDNYLLKKIITSIVDPLTHLLNFSITSGLVPKNMKIAKVIPIFKKGDKQEVNNYRPISLLTGISKILERIIYTRLINFLQINDIFSNFQFGFRKKHSTSHALLTFIEKVTQAIDNHSHMLGIFLDFSKAFDTIDHKILLKKVYNYGIRGKALEWFRSYLSDRQQYVCVNDAKSNTLNIECGVPQGSILGPLLFIIYMNDFHRSSSILSFILFADDSNLFFSHPDPHALLNTVNAELINVTEWIKANKLSLNLLKTKYMLFSNTIETLPGNIIFDETPLEKVNLIKFLGVYVDNKLSWKDHITTTCKTISRNIGVINKLKYVLPSSVLLMLYSSLILPYLNYGILVWGNTHQVLLEKLLLLQKKSMRIIFNLHPRTHTDDLFFHNKILKVKELYLFHLGQFMFKFKANNLPKVFDQTFNQNDSFHNYPTRHSNEYHLPLLRTILAQSTFVYTGPKFWNNLDDNLKIKMSIHSFKNKLKQLLLQTYIIPSNKFTLNFFGVFGGR